MRDLNECQPYVVHMRIEHRHINDLLQDLARLFAAAEDGGSVNGHGGPLSQRLSDLRHELARHFAEEDEGGCLEEAVSRCPSVSHEVDELEGEHPRLLAELDAVVDRVVKEAGSSAITRQFNTFVGKLNQHEATENHILQVAFGTGFEVN